jgi:hypothetical protein
MSGQNMRSLNLGQSPEGHIGWTGSIAKASAPKSPFFVVLLSGWKGRRGPDMRRAQQGSSRAWAAPACSALFKAEYHENSEIEQVRSGAFGFTVFIAPLKVLYLQWRRISQSLRIGSLSTSLRRTLCWTGAPVGYELDSWNKRRAVPLT